MITPKVQIRRLRRSSPAAPRYQSEQAAGFDLAADLDEPLTLGPGERAAAPTGLALVNAPGTIDADYRGEIKVILINLGEAPIVIKPGERIAQLIIAPVARAELIEVDELEVSPRGSGGFGQTGR